MRLVATEYLSLDGFFHEPGQWSGRFFNEEVAQFKWAELKESEALLLGRRTYEGFAAAWPGMRKETGEFGEKMNDMRKYVVSSTLTENALMREDLIDRYRFMIHPILLGRGARLFEGSNETVLSLEGSTRTFKSGIVVLEYERSRR